MSPVEFKFDAATFETIQNLVFPLIETFLGFNTAEWVGEQSELFIKVGEAFGDISSLFMVAGAALQDGRLTEQELKDIIANALSIGDAVDAVVGFFGADEPKEDPIDPIDPTDPV